MLTQIHDINPGGGNPGNTCPPDELDHPFWTAAIPGSSVHVNPGAGQASMHLTDFTGVNDFHDLLNAFFCGPSVPANTSLNVEWGKGTEHYNIRNEDVGFAGQFAVNSATLDWSASTDDGYMYDADPFSVGFAVVGKMRNGVFFP